MNILRSFLQAILIVGVIDVAIGKSVGRRNDVQCTCVSTLQCGASWRVGVEEDDESEENPCPVPGEVCCSKPSSGPDPKDYAQGGGQEASPWDETEDQEQAGGSENKEEQQTNGEWAGQTGETGTTWNSNPGREDEDQDHPRCTCVSSLKCGATLKTQVEEEEEEPNICEIPGEVCCPNSVVGGHEPETPQEVPEQPDDNHQPPNLGCGEFHSFTNPDTYIDANSFPGNYGESPWTVVMFHDQSYDLLEATFCGGSIIQENVVLTAAHCFVDRDHTSLTLRAGEWNIKDSSNAPLPYQDRKIQSYKIHPKFRSGYTPYDIAIIILEEPFNFALNVNPICLPNDYHEFDGEKCVASGWGILPGEEKIKPNIIKKIPMTVVTRKQCRDMLRKTKLGSHFYLDKGFTCALGEYGADTCEGDGGGPLVCPSKEHGQMILTGITSWGVDCGLGHPSAFTDVIEFKTWINEVLIEYGLQY